MLGHIIFTYADNGEVIFKQSKTINEIVAGDELVKPVLDFVKKNTTAQMLQKAKASGYEKFTKDNYNDLYPLQDDLYLIINLISNKVDFFAKHKPLFENEDVFELPETKENVLRLIGSYPIKQGGKGFMGTASLKADADKVLGELGYLRWINDESRDFTLYGDRFQILLHEPYTRLSKTTKEVLEKNGYKSEKDYNRWIAFKKIDHTPEGKEKYDLIIKESKALRIDRSYQEMRDYLQDIPTEKLIEWSNHIFEQTGQSIFKCKHGIKSNNSDKPYPSKEDYDFYGYVISAKEIEKIYSGLDFKQTLTLCKEYDPSAKDDTNYIIVDGYVKESEQLFSYLSESKIQFLLDHEQYIDDPEFRKAVKHYSIMHEFLEKHIKSW